MVVRKIPSETVTKSQTDLKMVAPVGEEEEDTKSFLYELNS